MNHLPHLINNQFYIFTFHAQVKKKLAKIK